MEIYMYFLLFISFIFLTKTLLQKKTHKNLPPSPPSLPIIGHLHLFKKPLYRTLAQLTQKHGPILYLRVGSRPVLVLSSPALFEETFSKNNDIVFANRPSLQFGKLMGNDYTTLIWAPYGANWRNQRRISAIEILSSHRVQTFSEIRLSETKSMIKQITTTSDEEDRTVDMKALFFDFTLNIMMLMIDGKRYYGDDVENLEKGKEFQLIVKESILISGASNLGDFLPVMKWIDGGFAKRLKSLKAKKDAYLQGLMDEKRKYRSEKGNDEGGKKASLIEVLLDLQEKEPDYYTDEMIRGFIWVLFAAGIDTSSGSMEWAMSLLLNNPDVMQKAQEEIDANVEQGRLLNESDLHKLPYLHCIINETLRMYPAGPLLVPHESSEDCVIGGYNIPRRTMLLANLWSIQHDPNIWDEPMKFKPERFNGVEGTRDGYKFMPFGSGRRGCPGEGFAMQVLGMTLGALLQCFHWERIGEEMVDMSEGTGGLTLHKAQPLVAKCRPRSVASSFMSKF
ncbi:hypothetical protein ACHQM5_025260 [Ranunculus cassubicifolius]